MFDSFSSCVYVIFGFEIAPQTGTKHIQAYCYFTNPTSYRRIKKFICTNPISGVESGAPHFIPAKGNATQNREYCIKKDSADPDFQGPRTWEDCAGEHTWPEHWEEYGDINGCPTQQGKRKDLESFTDAILNGTTVSTAVESKDLNWLGTFLKYPRGYDRIREAISTHRSQPPSIYWIYGETGTGKSRWAQHHYPSAYRYCKIGGQTVWWNGYDNHNEVIIDDVRADTFTFDYLLQLTDRYAFQGAIKGGDVKLNFNVMVFTAPFHWKDMYSNTVAECLHQLGRRITKTYKATDWPNVDLEQVDEYEIPVA